MPVLILIDNNQNLEQSKNINWNPILNINKDEFYNLKIMNYNDINLNEEEEFLKEYIQKYID